MKHAIVAVEDKRFYEHRGIDLRGMGRALWADVSNQRHGAGRLDDHAAVRQERVPDEPEDDRPQALRGGARVAARAALVEGPDPHRLPQHGLLRERRLRRRAGVAHLLPSQRRARCARPRRRSSRAFPRTRASGTRSRTRRRRRRAATSCCRQLYAQGYITLSQYGDGKDDPMPDPAKVNLPSTQGAGRRRTSRTTSRTSSSRSTARARRSAAGSG